MKLKHLLFVICVASLLFSCKNEDDPKGELITVKLSPSFISLNQDTDVPMKVKGNNVKMSVDPNQVVYAIQAYENDSAYYYGVFDNIDSMKIALTTGKTYHFKVATFKVGTGSGLMQVTQYDGKYFYLPNKTLLGNKFIKGNVLKDINLLANIKLSKTQIKDYPEIDAFYCDKSVAVTKGLTSIDFSLLRTGFGATFNVDTLTTGKVFVFIGNDTITLTSQNKSATTIRQFNVTNNADFTTIFNNSTTYGDSILVKAQWVGTNGTVINTQGKFKFMRNYMKTINIQLNTSSLNLNFEDWSNIPTNGLVAWYPFNGNANDESGNGYNATINESILTKDRNGKANSAYGFDGINDYINLNVKLPNAFTTSLWVCVDTFTTFVVAGPNYIGSKILSTMDNSIEKTGFEIGLDPSPNYGKNVASFWNTLTQNIESTYLIGINKWYLLTATYDGNTLKYYFNGVYDKSISASFIQNYKNIFLGARNVTGKTPAFFFKGKIDDVGIWNRVLTQEEITALYNAK